MKSLQFLLPHHSQDQPPLLFRIQILIVALKASYIALGNIWGSLNSPLQAKFFKILVMKKQFGNRSSHVT